VAQGTGLNAQRSTFKIRLQMSKSILWRILVARSPGGGVSHQFESEKPVTAIIRIWHGRRLKLKVLFIAGFEPGLPPFFLINHLLSEASLASHFIIALSQCPPSKQWSRWPEVSPTGEDTKHAYDIRVPKRIKTP
jgi:hypothetical protein